MSDVYLYWRSGSVHNVENVELPQFSIVEYRAITKIESLLTGIAFNIFLLSSGDNLCIQFDPDQDRLNYMFNIISLK